MVEFTGTLNDNKTLVWANNGGTTGSWLAGYANNALSGYQRIGRTWQFQEINGDISPVAVYYAT